MALTTFHIKQDDLLPVLAATLTLPDDMAYDLSSATSVKFIMRKRGASTTKVNAAASVTDAVNGRVQYAWTGTDTDTIGTYEGEFEVTVSGKKYTFPNDSHLIVIVTDDIA